MTTAAPNGTPPAVTRHPERREVHLHVNGDPVVLQVEPRRSLADTLRGSLGLTGTHLGCEHGVCGSCTILVDGQPVRSCLMLAVQADGRSLRTVEGLAADGMLHPLQEAFRDCHALQCGFCTPGFLMLLTGILEAEPDVSDDELAHVLSSNLCRCTGYAPIVEAARRARDRGIPAPPPPAQHTLTFSGLVRAADPRRASRRSQWLVTAATAAVAALGLRTWRRWRAR